MLDLSFYDGHAEVDISDYVTSNEWELLAHPGRRNVRYYEACCGDQPYPDLTFTLRLRRLSAFYNYAIMLPSVLLSCLTAVIFWLPPESPAKIMLGLPVLSVSIYNSSSSSTSFNGVPGACLTEQRSRWSDPQLRSRWSAPALDVLERSNGNNNGRTYYVCFIIIIVA